MRVVRVCAGCGGLVVGSRVRHNDGGTGFTANANSEFSGLVAGHLAADDHAPKRRRAPVGRCDTDFGEEVLE